MPNSHWFLDWIGLKNGTKTIGFSFWNLEWCNFHLGYRRNWGSWDLSTDGCKEWERGHIRWWNLHWEIHTRGAASGEHSEPWTTKTGKEKAFLAPFVPDYENSITDDWSFKNTVLFFLFQLGVFLEIVGQINIRQSYFCEIQISRGGRCSD